MSAQRGGQASDGSRRPLAFSAERRRPLDVATLQRLRPLLDEGEAEAIALAKRQQPEWLLMDETKGRAIAEGEGIRVIGLAGALVIAKQHGFVGSVAEILDALEREAGFYLSKLIRAGVLRSAGE